MVRALAHARGGVAGRRQRDPDGDRVAPSASRCVPAPAAGKALSKSALKNKKRKEKQAGKADDDNDEDDGADNGAPTAAPAQAPVAAVPSPADAENAKKVKNLQKKLVQIEQLREQQAQGKTLELNQLEKIKGESALRQELAALLKLS